jgi:DNA-binding protein HU-beta
MLPALATREIAGRIAKRGRHMIANSCYTLPVESLSSLRRMNMQKTDFIKAVADKTGATQKATGETVNAALQVITEALARGEKVTLTGFGTFEVRERQAREGVNPQTRAKIQIAASKTPGFTASSTLKDAVKG